MLNYHILAWRLVNREASRSALLMTLSPGEANRIFFCEKYTNEKLLSKLFTFQSLASLRNIYSVVV